MEYFVAASTVRLRSHHGTYLCAKDNRNGKDWVKLSPDPSAASWRVEPAPNSADRIRLRSTAADLYLTARNNTHYLGLTGLRIGLTLPSPAVPSPMIEWRPVRDGTHRIRLESMYGTYLRANGLVFPYKNTVTHSDVPAVNFVQWIVWEVDVVEYVAAGRVPQPFPPARESGSAPAIHRGPRFDLRSSRGEDQMETIIRMMPERGPADASRSPAVEEAAFRREFSRRVVSPGHGDRGQTSIHTQNNFSTDQLTVQKLEYEKRIEEMKITFSEQQKSLIDQQQKQIEQLLSAFGAMRTPSAPPYGSNDENESGASS